LEVEDIAIRLVTPQLYEIWKVLTSGNEVIKSRYFTLNGTRQRKSGQLMTGLGNTLVNYLAIKFALKLVGVEADFMVEGDDLLIGSNVEDLASLIIPIY